MDYGKKKPSVALVIGSAKRPQEMGGPDEKKAEEEGGGDEYESLAEEMISALHAKDAGQFSRALHAYIDLCSSDEESTEGEQSEG